MKNLKVLAAAIRRAYLNGWRPDIFRIQFVDQEGLDAETEAEAIAMLLQMDRRVEHFIFSHDFAKAFWKDAEKGVMWPYDEALEVWQGHLVSMVLSPEPIKYLEKFL